MRAEAAAANVVTDRADILGALQRASQATGADFQFLLDTATRESSLKPNAKASSSSAVGLFQFVEQTWLGMVKNYGAKYGLGSYADAISQSANGRFHTASMADRSAILALRKDPDVASLMAGEFAQATRTTMQQSLGRDVCSGELYAAHFLGPDAACRLIRMNDSHPEASAAHAFPAAAEANRNVFFHADGSAKSVREVYDWALKQPNGTQPLAPAIASPVPAAGAVDPVNMQDSAALLASVMSWRPSHGFFASAMTETGAVPSSPFPMTPNVVDVLSSMSPIAGDNATD